MNRILKQVAHRFAGYQIIPLSGGGTNALFLLDKDGIRSVLKVAMISNSKAAIEEKCLNLLKESQLVPGLFRKLLIEERTGLHMEYIDGETHLTLILGNQKTSDFDAIITLFSSLGELLAKVHCINIHDEMKLPSIIIEAPLMKSYIEDHLYRRSLDLISSIYEISSQDSVLLHGDFGYHNVIKDISGCNKLIDWELAGLGDPRVDIANILFWSHLHFPETAYNYVKAFIKSYLDYTTVDCSSEIMHSFVIYQIWRIIEMVSNDFPDHVKNEWNRRLSWALAHKFI